MSQAWRTRTRLVHGGSRRSGFGETSEALFLTSGFRYQRAEDAAERFADRAPGYTYSRVANPTVRMFEERLALLEGAEEAAATTTGMAAVHAALMSQLRAGDRVVGMGGWQQYSIVTGGAGGMTTVADTGCTGRRHGRLDGGRAEPCPGPRDVCRARRATPRLWACPQWPGGPRAR